MSRSIPSLLLGAMLLPVTVHAAPSPDQVAMSDAQIKRAAIATAPALATLTARGAGTGDAMILSGTVVSPPTAVVFSASPWGGMVQEVHVATLQAVKPGTPLVTLFSQPWMELQRDYVQAAAEARLARDKLARDESLFADGIIARVRVDESRAAAHLAVLAVDQRAQALGAGGLGAAAIKKLPADRTLSPRLVVRAQAAGTLVELPLATGQRVEPGMAVAKIVRDGPLWVELQASRQQLAALAVGDRLHVAERCTVKVIAISPQVNGANQTALIRAEQVERNSCLRVNAFVEARLERAQAQAGALAVPVTALVRRGKQNYVFVRNAQGFTAVPVEPGAAAGDQVWVMGALAAGSPVATRGVAAIKGAWSGIGEPAAAEGQP